MKRLFFSAALFLTCLIGYSQNVTVDKDGNFHAKTADTTKNTGKPTGKTYTDSKGIVYPVYISDTGRFFVIRTSKNTGKQYKQYLTASK